MLTRRMRDLADPVHGSVSDGELARLGLSRADVADFSHNTIPFGPLPAVERAAREADLSGYPDPDATALRRAIAAREGLSADQVICGNGSNELFWLIALAYLRRNDTALVLAPTYGEYERACRVVGARVTLVRSEPPTFHWRLEDVSTAFQTTCPRVVFLCNPNNPTGVYLEPDAIEAIVKSCAGALLVIDESYHAFVQDGRSAARLLKPGQGQAAPDLMVVRSMTKEHALAGVRLAYALAPPEHIQALRQIRPHWNVNAVAQAAGLAAIQASSQLEPLLRETRASAGYLAAALSSHGLAVVPSATHFFLARVGDASAFRGALLRYGCVVRDCTSFGLPAYVRIAARTRTECDRLIAAVRAVVQADHSEHAGAVQTGAP
jgi:histidinol-phosphate aminotransferase